MVVFQAKTFWPRGRPPGGFMVSRLCFKGLIIFLVVLVVLVVWAVAAWWRS